MDGGTAAHKLRLCQITVWHIYLLTLVCGTISVCVPATASVVEEPWDPLRRAVVTGCVQGLKSPDSGPTESRERHEHQFPLSSEHKGRSPIILHIMKRGTGIWQGKMGAFSCFHFVLGDLISYVVMNEVLALESA